MRYGLRMVWAKEAVQYEPLRTFKIDRIVCHEEEVK